MPAPLSRTEDGGPTAVRSARFAIRGIGLTALLAPIVLIAPSVLSAQTPDVLRGRVVDPEDDPLGQVDVRAMGSFDGAVTGRDGRFRVELPEGVDRVRFRRIGYRTRTLTLREVREKGTDGLKVVLEPRPVELKGLTVENPASEGAPVLGRTVTTETVRQAPALGEADVFRSLVYLPEVSQPNDLKGRLHLAGGSSDETGYRLDGHPLQEPFHLLGLVGAFNVAALEDADVLTHRYPVGEGGRLSGLIRLRTRRPGDEPTSEVVVSPLSSSFTTVRPDLPGGIDVLASGRLTYLDRIAAEFSDDVPELGFYDGLVRLGRSWAEGWRTELVGYRTRNYFRGGDIKDVERQQEPLQWGESLVGFRLERNRDAWRWELRGSVDRATTSLDERPVDDDVIDATRDWWSADLQATRSGRDVRLTAGVSVDHRRHAQMWRTGELAEELFSPNSPAEFSGSDELTTAVVFGEVAVDVVDRLRASVGSRAVASGDDWHAAPRAHLAYRASDEVGMELSAGRRLQFDAEIEEPVEGSILPPRFLVEDPRRTDVLAAAAEWTPGEMPVLGTEGRLRVVGFWKRYPNRPLLADAESLGVGGEPPPGFPRFRRVRGRSFGASVGLRFRIGDEGLFQGSYSYQRAREEVEGEWSPTTWDAPHDLSLFTSVPLFAAWTANAAFRLHSGRAVTPVRNRVFVPERGFGDRFLLPRFFFGDRNSLRLGRYTRLDLGVRHRFDWIGADWVLFAQVLNALGARNPIDVDFRELLRGRATSTSTEGGAPGIRTGLPTVPSLGVEVRW